MGAPMTDSTYVQHHVDILRSSEKFRQWHVEPVSSDDLRCYMTAEKHYAPDELAELWGVSTETVRSIFRDEPGVLKIGKTGSRYKRGYVTLRIPEEVAERVHRKLSA
jgi:hypothetical protein